MTHDCNKLLMLESMRDEGIDGDPEWERGRAREQKCKWCARPPIGFYPNPLEVVVQLRQRASLSIAGPAVCVFKRNLFDLLLPFMPGMIPGEVRYATGRVLSESVTVHFPPEPEIVMRGGPGTRESGAYSPCPVCGRIRASRALFTKPWHVLRRDIPEGDLYRTNENVLLLSEQLAGELDLSEFPDLKLTPLAVLDKPLEVVPELGDSEADVRSDRSAG